MYFSKGSFKLDNKAGEKDEVTGWLPFTPRNLVLIPVAAVAVFFVKNLWLFGLASLVLGIIFYKKIKEEYKNTKSNAMCILMILVSVVIFAFCIIVLYRVGSLFRETGIN